jgi:hypothetical protein
MATKIWIVLLLLRCQQSENGLKLAYPASSIQKVAIRDVDFGVSVDSWPLQIATAFFGFFLFLLPTLFLQKLQLDFGLTQSSLDTLLQFLAVTLMRLPWTVRLMSLLRSASI